MTAEANLDITPLPLELNASIKFFHQKTTITEFWGVRRKRAEKALLSPGFPSKFWFTVTRAILHTDWLSCSTDHEL